MPGLLHELPRFLRELKRRKVYRVTAGYLVTACIVLQLASLAADAFGFPGWFEPMIWVVAGLGLPRAVVLAWAYEVTPERVRRTGTLPPDEADAAPGKAPSRRRPARREATETLLLRKGVWLKVTGATLLAVVAVGVWLAVRSSQARRAREEAIPRVQDLLADQRFADACALVREARDHLPNDPVLRDLEESSSVPRTFRSRPSGATVSYKSYLQPHQEWVTLGTTPLEEVRVPAAELRWRARLAGHAPARGSTDPERDDVEAVLFPQEQTPPGMVYVPPGRARAGWRRCSVPCTPEGEGSTLGTWGTSGMF